MSTQSVTPTVVVLPSAVWRQELEAELVRLGVPATKAASSAGRVLHRICGHAGWPRSEYLVAEAVPRTSEVAP